MSNDNLILHHFSRNEFGPTDHRNEDWWEAMAPDLLTRLDVFRSLWDRPVIVSGHARALGRRSGNPDSDHAVETRGAVHAADVFLAGLDSQRGAERAKEIAELVGMGSIGLYPDWSRPGLHLGIRPGRGGPRGMATWGAVLLDGRQEYVSWGRALEGLRK